MSYPSSHDIISIFLFEYVSLAYWIWHEYLTDGQTWTVRSNDNQYIYPTTMSRSGAGMTAALSGVRRAPTRSRAHEGLRGSSQIVIPLDILAIIYIGTSLATGNLSHTSNYND
eukprot:scaffold98995_cov19-Prasinocladus_malaysianus.AAC.2